MIVTSQRQSTGNDLKEDKRSAIKEQRVLNGIEAQTAVLNAGGAFWPAAHDWAQSRKILTPMESGILQVASEIPNRLPSEKESLKAIEVLRKMHSDGYQHGIELV